MTIVTRLLVALVLFPLANAVVFGAFLIFIMATPAMVADAEYFLIAALKTSLLVAGPLAWECAPALLSEDELRSK
jgi:hypothetical protein